MGGDQTRPDQRASDKTLVSYGVCGTVSIPVLEPGLPRVARSEDGSIWSCRHACYFCLASELESSPMASPLAVCPSRRCRLNGWKKEGLRPQQDRHYFDRSRRSSVHGPRAALVGACVEARTRAARGDRRSGGFAMRRGFRARCWSSWKVTLAPPAMARSSVGGLCERLVRWQDCRGRHFLGGSTTPHYNAAGFPPRPGKVWLHSRARHGSWWQGADFCMLKPGECEKNGGGGGRNESNEFGVGIGRFSKQGRARCRGRLCNRGVS